MDKTYEWKCPYCKKKSDAEGWYEARDNLIVHIFLEHNQGVLPKGLEFIDCIKKK